MSNQLIETRSVTCDSIARLADKLAIGAANILPFEDFTDFMTSFFDFLDSSDRTIIVAGHATPDIEIAADRADMKVVEMVGESPFVGSTAEILDIISTGQEIVYMANPNWVTGTSYALNDVKKTAAAIPRGRLILDEKYLDSCGLSGLSLLTDYPQIVIVRSLPVGSSDRSEDSGYILGPTNLIQSLEATLDDPPVSSSLSAAISHSLVDEDLLTRHKTESLRVATQLTRLGFQNRITQADFLLLRVADPKQVGNYLARFNIPVENLDGYPGLRHYMKFRLRRPENNDRLVAAIDQMPVEFYRMSNIDQRPARLHKSGTRTRSRREKQPARRLKAGTFQP